MRHILGVTVLETLEEIADPKHTALLVIDLQNDCCSPRGFLGSQGGDISWQREVVARAQVVLDEARRLGVLVIFTKIVRSKDGSLESAPRLRIFDRSVARWREHIREKRDQGGYPMMYVEGTWGSEVVDDVAPRPGERQIVKYRSSAFMGTPLDMILRNSGVKAAVVLGSVTEGCVETTVRDLEQHGYYPVVPSDCVCSNRRDLHDAALLVMAARYDVVTSEDLLKVWRSAKPATR